ncbi:MAG: M24 family metallopeptidase [Planctomycetota bacterium]
MPADYLPARRRRIAAALAKKSRELAGDGAPLPIVLVGAGEMIPVAGAHDRTYPYIAHSHYYYLAEQECPGGVLAIDLEEAEAENPWHAFAPEVTDARRTWEGDVEWEGRPLAEFAAWLAPRVGAGRGRAIAALGNPPAGINVSHGVDGPLAAALDDAFLHARRVLDDREIDLMQRAAEATAHGHAWAREHITSGTADGVTERAIQIELEAEFFRGGGDATAYDTIVGCGANAAVLHFFPSERVVHRGECVLIDAGAQVRRYAADVTRTWPVGEPTSVQRDLINIVCDAEESAIAMCVPGVEWHDVHRHASERVLEGLAGLGALKGDPAELVERGIAALFFPHGVGHMIGLGVRGAGGRQPGRAPRPGPGEVRVRVDMPLAAGHGFTVEPGLYFIPQLIDPDATRQRFADAVNWSTIDALRTEIQGIRIEDDIVIREGRPEVLTSSIEKRPG